MGNHILIIDDDLKLTELITRFLENQQFRNLLLKKQKIFLDENVANQGSASINLIKFLDNL